MKSLARVRSFWQETGVPLQSPASHSQVEELWRRFNQPLSTDVLSLYTTFGGFEELVMDRTMWCFWTLERIEAENVGRSATGMAFSDFLICSHFYVLQFESPMRSSVWLEGSPEHRFEVASSLEEFFERYLDDPTSLYLLPEES